MTQPFIIIPAKPAEGEPCNGCGACCTLEACQISREYLNSAVTPCIALEWNGARFGCGMVFHPSRYLKTPEFSDGLLGSMFAEALGITQGIGCDSDMPAGEWGNRTK